MLVRRIAYGRKSHAERSWAVQLKEFNPIVPWAVQCFPNYLTQGSMAVNKKPQGKHLEHYTFPIQAQAPNVYDPSPPFSLYPFPVDDGSCSISRLGFRLSFFFSPIFS
jgi:hypothetical protein